MIIGSQAKNNYNRNVLIIALVLSHVWKSNDIDNDIIEGEFNDHNMPGYFLIRIPVAK